MANPITWRNINAPSFAGVQQGLTAGSQSVSNGLKTLENAARGIGNERQRVADETKGFNTQTLMNQISGLDNLEGYDTLNDDVRASLAEQGAGVDSAKVLAALGQRDNTLRQDATDTFNYNETLRTRDEALLKEQVNSLRQQKKFDEAESLLNGSNIRDKSGLFGSIETDRRNEIAYGRNEEAFQRAEESRNDEASISELMVSLADRMGDNTAAAKNVFRKRLIDMGVEPTTIENRLNTFDTEFESLTALSSDDQAVVISAVATAQDNYERDKVIRDRDLGTAMEQLPVDERFSFSDPNRLSQETGMSYVLSLAPENNTVDNSDGTGGPEMMARIRKDVLPDLRKALGLKKGAEVPGIILQLAATDIGTTEELVGVDRSLNVDALRTKALEIAARYQESQSNFAKRQELIKANDADDEKAYQTFRSTGSKTLKQVEETNKRIAGLTGSRPRITKEKRKINQQRVAQEKRKAEKLANESAANTPVEDTPAAVRDRLSIADRAKLQAATDKQKRRQKDKERGTFSDRVKTNSAKQAQDKRKLAKLRAAGNVDGPD